MSIEEIIKMAHNYGCLYESTLSEVYSEESLLKDLKKQLTLTDVLGRSEQLNPLPPNECEQCGVLIDHRLNECGNCQL